MKFRYSQADFGLGLRARQEKKEHHLSMAPLAVQRIDLL